MSRRMVPQKAKDPKKTFRRLMREIMHGHMFMFILTMVCIVISAVTSVYISQILRELIDDYITPLVGVRNPDFSPLLKCMKKWAFIMIAGIASSYLQSRIMLDIAQKTILDIRNRMFDKLETLPIRYFDENQHGKIMSRFTNDVDTLQQMITQAISAFLGSSLTVICVFVAMIFNSWILTLIVLASLLVLLKATGSIAKKSGRNFALQQKNLAAVNGYIEEMTGGSRVVKTFTHEDRCREEFEEINEDLRVTMTKANAYANIMMPVVGNIGNIQYVILVFAGSILTLLSGGAYTIGSLAAFLNLSKSFIQPVAQASQQMNFFLQALAGAERIFDLLDQKSEDDDGYVSLYSVDEHTWVWNDTRNHIHTELRGSIVLDHVDFGYNEEKTVLHDISLYAKPGQKIAFVGSTGAGKTTITNLLNRFYDIHKGTITFDGIDIRNIRKDDLRHSLGIVLQDTHLFTGTIKENIRYGKPDATDEEVMNAAKLANAHDFIMMMKDGYDTMIGNDGEGLSQGQRQLISISRAAVLNPPVLIMDEATSSIDTHTEKLVQNGMDRLMQGRTVFVIAHRLSTVRNSNAIMVLENGRIIERGTHEDLLDMKGTYWSLYTGSTELE